MTQEKQMPLLSDLDIVHEGERRYIMPEVPMETGFTMKTVAYASKLNEQIAFGAGGRHVRDHYESARQSDLAKIEALTKLAQELVDAAEDSRVELCSAIPHLPKIGVKLATQQEEACRKVLASAALLSITPTPEP